MSKPCWVCFTTKNGKLLSSGETIRDAVKLIQGIENVIAIGVNCVKPKYVVEIIKEIKKETNKPIVVYPNAGETFNAKTK